MCVYIVCVCCVYICVCVVLIFLERFQAICVYVDVYMYTYRCIDVLTYWCGGCVDVYVLVCGDCV